MKKISQWFSGMLTVLVLLVSMIQAPAVQAQVATTPVPVCPAGYTCTPIPAQPVGCPSGYVCSSGPTTPGPQPTPQPIPVQNASVTIDGRPSLDLNYSSFRESLLTASFNVAVNGGVNGVQIYKNYAGYQFVNETKSGTITSSNATTLKPLVALSPNVTTINDVSGQPMFVVPAGQTFRFKVVVTDNPQQMFAGAYHVSLNSLLVTPLNVLNGETSLIPISSNKTNTKTIVGERSPYITSLTSPAIVGQVVTITGQRLNDTIIIIDGQPQTAIKTKVSQNNTVLTFVLPKVTTNENNSHYLSLQHKTTGMSNKVGFEVGASNKSSITVLNPNGSSNVGEYYRTGDILKIKWNSKNIPASEMVKIELGYTHTDPTYPAGTYFEDWIIEKTPNTGSYNWVIPKYYGTGIVPSSFTVKVSALGVSDYSDRKFKIVAGDIGNTGDNITVTSPTMGAGYYNGDVANISWISDGKAGYSVNLLRKSDPYFLRLSMNTEGASPNLTWKIPSDIPKGDDYFIKVSEGLYRNKTGYSPTFSIKQNVSQTSSTDLIIKNVTKANAPYQFYANVCMNGSKSINDLKKENSLIKGFPWQIIVHDSNGVEYKDGSDAIGGIENLKNGQCMTDIAGTGLLLSLHENQYPPYNQLKRAVFRLDPDNIIPEINEKNDFTFFAQSSVDASKPILSSISPASGPNLSNLTLYGSTFLSPYSIIVIKSNVNGTSVDVSPNSVAADGKSMSVIISPNLPLGSYDVSVVNLGDGKRTASDNHATFTLTGQTSSSAIVTASASLVSANVDMVGGAFVPGASSNGKVFSDWHWTVNLQGSNFGANDVKKIQSMTLYHSLNGEGWSTSGSPNNDLGKGLYPLLVIGKGFQSTAYDQEIGLANLSQVNPSFIFDIWGQPESTVFRGGRLVIKFTDGTSVTVQIPSSTITPSSNTASVWDSIRNLLGF